MLTYVYVAGPIYSSGRAIPNVRRAVLVGEEIRRAGLVPFIPHLNCFWEFVQPEVSDEEWLAWDFAWLEKCDALYRLSGVSRGADREEALARERGMPVFLEGVGGLAALIEWAKGRKS